MRFNREELLHKMEAVSAGLATQEAVEQSSCFVFLDGNVITFNDEVACTMACPMCFEGAVSAKPFMELLGKLVEEDVDVSVSESGSEVIVKGKRRRAGITLEAEITLPVGSIEKPVKWNPMDPEFSDAVSVVQHCAGKDPNYFHLMCIHITPDHVEACDNYQMARYPIDTGLTEDCMVKRNSLKHIVGLGMTEVSETSTWIHYRNPVGLTLSVRRETGIFRDITSILNTKGTPTTLPGGLAEAVSKAEIFTGETADNVVIVEFKKNKMRLKGIGSSGWYEEVKAVKWEDEPLSFSLSPKLLADITTRTNDCELAPGILKINGGRFVYVTSLGKVD